MQEEITQGAVSLSVEAGKMTADLLQKALKKVLEEMQKKPSQRTLRQGKQMCVNGHACGAVGNDVCGLWKSRRLFHRAVNGCFPSAERPFSTFP